MEEVVLKNAVIVTQNKEREIIKGDIKIENGIISEIGHIDEDGEDLNGSLLIPGFINTHTHVATTLLRGKVEDLVLHDWLEKIMSIEEKMNEKDVEIGTYLAVAEMIRSGTTAFVDMWDIFGEKIKEVVEKIGIRAILGPTMVEGKDLNKLKKRLKNFKGKFVIPSFNAHSVYLVDEEDLEETKAFANENNVLFQMHISETRKELFEILNKKKKRPFEYLFDLGILDKKTLLSHAVFVSKREILLAGKHKVNISHVPVSNLKLAVGGTSPIIEFDERSSNITLGTDSVVSNNSLNLIETMKISALLQKNFYWDASKINAQKVFDFATINASKLFDNKNGSIEVGKKADIVILKDLPNIIPRHNIIANIVYSLNPSNIKDVIINGKYVMKNNKILAFDEEKLLEKAKEQAKDWVER